MTLVEKIKHGFKPDKGSLKRGFNHSWYYLIAALIPVVVVIAMYKVLGIYPFGNNSILNMDLWGQYFPMLSEQARNGFFSGFSWTGGLGFNSYAQSAYYCNNLTNLFYKPFEGFGLINAIDYVAVLRFALAGLTCAIYFKYHFKKRSVLLSVGASAYALCSYCIAFISQVMWIDSVIYFPLIVLGIEKLINERRPLMYCISLALALWSNFYIGFCICIFSAFYFVAKMIDRPFDRNFKKGWLYPFLTFSAFSILAAGICAFTILPTYDAVSQTVSSSAGFHDEIKSYHTMAEYIYALFPSAKLSFEYGVPNVNTGAFVFILLPIFFLNREVPFKKKLVFGAFLLFLYFSMNINALDFIWHGFHFPNQLPGRWTFMFSFVLVLLSLEGLNKIEGVRIRCVVASYIAAIAMINFAKYALTDDQLAEDDVRSAFTKLIILSTVYAVMLIAMRLFDNKDLIGKAVGRFMKRDISDASKKHLSATAVSVACCLLSAVIFFDIGSNAINAGADGIKVSDAKGYASVIDTIAPYVDQYKSDETDFYRMEANSGWTFDPGQLWGYKGVGIYSSVLSANSYKLLSGLGHGVYATNISIVANNYSPVLNSIFAVRYILDRDRSYSAAGMERTAQYETCDVYENKYTLPIAFKVSENVLSWQPDENGRARAIDAQNDLLSALCGGETGVFDKIGKSGEQPIAGGTEYTYTVPTDGYVFLQHNQNTGKLGVTAQGSSPYDVSLGYERFKSLGKFTAGDKITLTVTEADAAQSGIELYTFNEQSFANVYERLSRNGMKVDYVSNSKVEGTIDAGEGGVIFTSVPNDGGWTVKCDGEKIETLNVGGLIGLRLPAGTHELKFSYTVPGLLAGGALSVICLAVLVLLMILRSKLSGVQKENKAADNDSVETASEETEFVSVSSCETDDDSISEINEE